MESDAGLQRKQDLPATNRNIDDTVGCVHAGTEKAPAPAAKNRLAPLSKFFRSIHVPSDSPGAEKRLYLFYQKCVMKLFPLLVAVVACVVLAACSKDTFETKPTLEIIDYNTREVFQGNTLQIVMNYTDKEGDLSQGTLTAMIRRQNQIPILDPNQDKADSLWYVLPEFPARDKGEITFRLGYDFLKETLSENDTIRIRFTVTDQELNVSDSVLTEPIVIHLP